MASKFKKSEIEAAWGKAQKIRGKNPNLYRRDCRGNEVYKPSYEKHGSKSWVIVASRGGENGLLDLQILQADSMLAVGRSIEKGSVEKSMDGEKCSKNNFDKNDIGLPKLAKQMENDQKSDTRVEICLGSSIENPALIVSPLSADFCYADGAREYRSINLTDSKIDRLAPLLQALPSVFTAAEFFRGSYMEVIINGPLAVAGDNLFHAFARGGGGKIAEQAKLAKGLLSTLVAPAAILQIASCVLAQKHLADISKKLNDIKIAVQRVEAFQKAERKFTISAALDYFIQVAPSILQGEFQYKRNEMENWEGKLLGIQFHLENDLKREINNIEKLESGNIFFSKIQEAEKHTILLDDLMEQWLLCLRARAFGWQLLSMFPEEQFLKESRLKSILSSLNSMNDRVLKDKILFKLAEKMKKKIKEQGEGLFENKSDFNNKMSALNKWVKSIPQFNENIDALKLRLSNVEIMLAEQQRPLTLLVKLEAGKITEAFEMGD